MAVKQKVVNVRVPPDLHEFVVAQAARELMTISTWVCRLLANTMAERKAQSNDRDKRGRSAS